MTDHYYDGPDFSEKLGREEEKEIRGETKYDIERDRPKFTKADTWLLGLMRAAFDSTSSNPLHFEGLIQAREIIQMVRELGFTDLAKEMEDDL